jgi:predicted ATPase
MRALDQLGGQTLFLGLLAECCERAGLIDEALDHLATALDAAERTGEQFYLAEIYRLRGEWQFAHRRDEIDAEASFLHAMEIAQRQQAKMWELRATCCLARLQHHQGKRAVARELLAPVYAWFTEGFDTVDLQEAKALLDQLA